MKEFDLVVLNTNGYGLKKGTKGTIVNDTKKGVIYEVEFFTNEKSLGVFSIFAEDLIKE